MNVFLVTIAHPRIEWPFLENWCEKLVKLGIDKVFIGEDQQKKTKSGRYPFKNVWSTQYNDKEVQDVWNESVRKSRQVMDIEIHPFFKKNLVKAQLKLHHDVIEKHHSDCDWIISMDIDEMLILSQGNLKDYLMSVSHLDVIHFNQIMFDSRWQKSYTFPENIHFYHPAVVKCAMKYIYKSQIGKKLEFIHYCDAEHECFIEDNLKAVYHHFRGKVTELHHVGMQQMSNFWKKTEYPMKMVDVINNVKLI